MTTCVSFLLGKDTSGIFPLFISRECFIKAACVEKLRTFSMFLRKLCLLLSHSSFLLVPGVRPYVESDKQFLSLRKGPEHIQSLWDMLFFVCSEILCFSYALVYSLHQSFIDIRSGDLNGALSSVKCLFSNYASVSIFVGFRYHYVFSGSINLFLSPSNAACVTTPFVSLSDTVLTEMFHHGACGTSDAFVSHLTPRGEVSAFDSFRLAQQDSGYMSAYIRYLA